VVLSSLAFPLQLKASQFGAALLEWRHVPVSVAGNVIHLPGRSLFVTEACSGLRSLTALLSLGLLIGALFLKSTPGRVLLVLASLPVAMLLNGLRIFLTGFLVYFVSPRLGEGVMHYSQGWAMFVVAFAMLGGLAFLAARLERLVPARRSVA
jgi:exosortase